MRVLSAAEMKEKLGIGRTTLWRWERRDDFPKRRQLGPNRVGWLEDEVDRWLKTRPRPGTEDAST